MITPKIVAAEMFATRKHQKQVRKYTGEPYIGHCRSVANTIAIFEPNEDTICAALLHDTLEDTETSADEIESLFGPQVAKLVGQVTDRFSSPYWGNRAKRKHAECVRLGNISPEAQTIKLADLIDNTRSIVQHDPGFAVVYLQEKEALLKVLTKGSPTLHVIATQHVKWGKEKLQELGL